MKTILRTLITFLFPRARRARNDPAETRLGGDPGGPYTWVGHFQVTLSNHPTGLRQIFHMSTLGIYPTEAHFLAEEDAEVSLREDLIRAQFAGKNMPVEAIELLRVDRLSLLEFLRERDCEEADKRAVKLTALG